jgi:hypothetical protein
MLPIFLLGTVSVLTVGVYVWVNLRSGQEHVKTYWRCPHCKQKVHDPSCQARLSTLCPHCKRRLTFPSKQPEPSQPGSRTVHYRVRRKNPYAPRQPEGEKA